MNKLKTSLTKVLAFALFPLLLTGCVNSLFDDGEIRYDDVAQVEFKPLDQTLTLAADEAQTLNVAVQLIGEQRNEDVNLDFVVAEGTDAVEGDHYTLSSNSVTIPANSSSATIDISVTGENLQAGETVTLVLELQGNDAQNVKAGDNIKTYRLTLQGGGS